MQWCANEATRQPERGYPTTHPLEGDEVVSRNLLESLHDRFALAERLAVSNGRCALSTNLLSTAW